MAYINHTVATEWDGNAAIDGITLRRRANARHSLRKESRKGEFLHFTGAESDTPSEWPVSVRWRPPRRRFRTARALFPESSSVQRRATEMFEDVGTRFQYYARSQQDVIKESINQI